MTRRSALVLLVVALLLGPLLWIIFPSASEKKAKAPTAAELANARCKIRDDIKRLQSFEVYELPTPGFYEIGQAGPDYGPAIHALAHSYTMIKYRSDAPRSGLDELRDYVQREGEEELLLATDGGPRLPYQLAAVGGGQQLLCRYLNHQAILRLRNFPW